MECYREYMDICKSHKKPLKYSFFIHHKQVEAILLKYRGGDEDYDKFSVNY